MRKGALNVFLLVPRIWIMLTNFVYDMYSKTEKITKNHAFSTTTLLQIKIIKVIE